MWGREVTALMSVLTGTSTHRRALLRDLGALWARCLSATPGRNLQQSVVLYDALMKHDHESTRAGVDWEGRRSSDEGRGSLPVYLKLVMVFGHVVKDS